MGSIKIYIITFIIGLSIGIAIGWGLLESGTKKTSIKWKFGQNELDINLEQDLINSTTFLEKLFSEDFSKNGALAWLKANQKLYHFTDPHIVDEYRELDENDIVFKYESLGKRWDTQKTTRFDIRVGYIYIF